MDVERVAVVMIGGGQAGLSLSYSLTACRVLCSSKGASRKAGAPGAGMSISYGCTGGGAILGEIRQREAL
jgi:hypothetical protein